MSTKSPGVYITTTDNTEYFNNTVYAGTSCAIVGYATKGPIGVPTYINSLDSYVKKFGSGVSGYYSYMAAKNVFSAGGTVLFTRVADDTASPSKLVIKNGVSYSNGYTEFNKQTNILVGSAGYENSKIYTLVVTDELGNQKTFYVESPSTGQLTMSSILGQLSAQIAKTSGSYKLIAGESTASNNEGLFSFGLKIGSEYEFPEIVGGSTHPIFIELSKNRSTNVIGESIYNAIVGGTNACHAIMICDKDGSNIQVEDGICPELYEEIDSEDNEVAVYKFKLIKDGTISNDIAIGPISKGITYIEFADKLDEVLKNHGIRVITHIDSGNNLWYVFVNKSRGLGTEVEIRSFTSNSNGDGISMKNDLFVAAPSASSNVSEFAKQGSGTEDDQGQGHIFVSEATKIASVQSSLVNTKIKYSYDSSLNAITFETTETGEGRSVELTTVTFNGTTFGTPLVAEDSGDADAGIGKVVKIEGQGSMAGDFEISKSLTTKKIRFINQKGIEPVKLSNTTEALDTSIFGNLLTIVGGATKVQGNLAVPPTAKDMVVITTKENGSGVSTESSPLSVEYTYSIYPNGEKRVSFSVYLGTTLKEYWSDFSIDYEAEDDRLDRVVNQTVENGGSEYIHMEIIKNDLEDPEIQFPVGKYNIGLPNTASDVIYNKNNDITRYDLYDYSVGTDGIPEDGDAIFMEALDPDTSALSNTEFYKYSILITPDNISTDVQDVAIALCEKNELAVYIADPPAGLTKDAVISWHNGKGYDRYNEISSKFAAVYSPWVRVGTDWVMPSVIMAGKWVYVDNNYGSWFAPAGETYGQLNASDVETIYTQKDRDDLYVEYNRVNPIIKYSDGRILTYGEKTCQRKNTVLTKIHVVRMVCEIRAKLQSALKPFIFMPTLQTNIQRAKGIVSNILEAYKTGGGISTYNVVCDTSNNTTETLQQDILYCDVSIVPVGCIEEISISLALNKSE